MKPTFLPPPVLRCRSSALCLVLSLFAALLSRDCLAVVFFWGSDSGIKCWDSVSNVSSPDCYLGDVTSGDWRGRGLSRVPGSARLIAYVDKVAHAFSLWDIEANVKVGQIRNSDNIPRFSEIVGLAYRPVSGELVFSRADGLFVLHPESGEVSLLDLGYWSYSIEFLSPDVVLFGTSGRILRWDLSTGRELGRWDSASGGWLGFGFTFKPVGGAEEPIPVVSGANDQFVPVGASAVFRVHASGPGPMSFQWFRDQTPLEGATSSELVVGPVGVADDLETYWVKVSNSLATVESSRGLLRVLPFAITPYPAMELEFPSQTNKTYTLLYTLQASGAWADVDPADIWSPSAYPLNGTGDLIRVIVSVRDNKARFFKVREQ